MNRTICLFLRWGRVCTLIQTVFAVLLTNVALAQARPDTSRNSVISDTLRQRRLAEQSTVDTAAFQDSIAASLPFIPKPKKAALYSAVLPGAGQVYNRQIWKVPIIYAGMGASFYFLVLNTNDYRRFRRSHLALIDTDISTVSDFGDLYSAGDLEILRDQARRFLDITVLVSALGYTVQVLDALVYAHLRDFDVSKDISLRFAPVRHPGGIGFGLVANWR